MMGRTMVGFLVASVVFLAFTPSSPAGHGVHGLGFKFELFGTAQDSSDPENPSNDVIKVNTTGVAVAGAVRKLDTKFGDLNNQLSFKYFFPTSTTPPTRSCGGGSPRVTLVVDANGDKIFDQGAGDFAAHGHPSPFVGCAADKWVFENLTDDQLRWEVTPGGVVVGIPVFPFVTWDTLRAAVEAQFPDNVVLRGLLVDDSGGFFAAAAGIAFYDLVTIGNGTLQGRNDTAE